MSHSGVRLAQVAILGSALLAGCGGTSHPTGTSAKQSQTNTTSSKSSTKVSSLYQTPPAGGGQASPSTVLGGAQFYMVSPSDGWAVTTLEVARTTDGGLDWTVVDQMPLPQRSVYFLDPEHGWVMDQHDVFSTSNGGQTWTQSPLPAAAEQDLTVARYGEFTLDFVDPDHGWLAIVNMDSKSAEPVDIFATSDGGAHWSLVDHTAATGGSAGALPLDLRGGTMRFSSPRVGWYRSTVPATSATELFRTTDGGKTWATQSFPYPKGISASNYHLFPGFPELFGAHGVAWATLVPKGAAPPQPPVLYVSTDGGDTWSPVATSLRGGTRSAAFILSASTWLVAELPQSIWVTTDAGTSWTNVAVKAFPSQCTRGNVAFVSPKTGFVFPSPTGTSGAVCTTTDGGATWTGTVMKLTSP